MSINNPCEGDSYIPTPPHIIEYDLNMLRKQQTETDMKLNFLLEKISKLVEEITHLKSKISELERLNEG